MSQAVWVFIVLVVTVGLFASDRLRLDLVALLSLLALALTSVLTATTVLLAPVAFATASDLGLAPQPLLMTMAVAASTAFATPVASPVNALVLAPGGYRFRDFLRVGLPIALLLLPATLLVVPWFFPLRP